MRVALVPSAYTPSLGGVEELTRRLADRLVTNGDQVEVWTFRHPDDLPADEVINGLRVRRFAFPLPSARPVSLLRFPARARATLAELSRATDDFAPDLLHVQCFSANGIYATALAARRRLPLVVTLQGETIMDDHDIYQRSTSLRLGLRLAMRRADVVTACSRFVLDDAQERFGLPPGQGMVIPNGVELDGDDAPRALDVPFDRFVLGLGRVVHKKGFDLLLAAFATIADDHPHVGLVVGGDGPSRSELRRQALAMGLGDRVHLPGPLDRAHVAWAMSNAEVFVLPSRVEPFGIVVLEALRAGRPVIVSSEGGATDIVRDGREGLVADPSDTPELATAISRLLSDTDRARAMGRAGRQRVTEYGWDRVASRYRDVYRSAA